MKELVSYPAVQIFMGTFPILAVVIWNLIKVDKIQDTLMSQGERIAKLEESNKILDRIEKKLDKIEERLTTIELIKWR
jgi:hypothetical protein